MANGTYEIGSLAGTYYERQKKAGGVTPKALRDVGKFLDLRYNYESLAMTRNRSPYVDRFGIERFPGTYSTADSITGVVVVSKYAPPIEAEVISRLANKWRNTDLNVGLLLSPEGRESIEMSIEAMQKICNATKSLKQGNFGGFMRHMNKMPRKHVRESHHKFQQGDISGAFLSAHLGWTPLIQDVYAGLNIDPPLERGTRIRVSRAGTPAVMTLQYPARADSVTLSKEGRVIFIGDVSRPPNFAARFGLDNPFLTAWNLVPLSFVADYFLPIGSVIDSMGFISAARFSQLWRKEYTRENRKWSCPKQVRVNSPSYGPLYNRDTCVRFDYELIYERKPYVLNFADPLRSMRVKLPTSIMKLGTIAALTHQRILALK